MHSSNDAPMSILKFFFNCSQDVKMTNLDLDSVLNMFFFCCAEQQGTVSSEPVKTRGKNMLVKTKRGKTFGFGFTSDWMTRSDASLLSQSLSVALQNQSKCVLLSTLM